MYVIEPSPSTRWRQTHLGVGTLHNLSFVKTDLKETHKQNCMSSPQEEEYSLNALQNIPKDKNLEYKKVSSQSYTHPAACRQGSVIEAGRGLGTRQEHTHPPPFDSR